MKVIKRFQAFFLSRYNGGYQRLVAERKQKLLGGWEGNILEIGPGTGSNLVYYRKDVRWIGLEPNPYMHPHLLAEADRVGLSVDLCSGDASEMDVEDASVDAVVSTLVLCSVRNVQEILREVLRVLKPGGRFVFIEHVAAPCRSTLWWLQKIVKPVWIFVADGCHPDRETWEMIELAGFERVELEHFRVTVPLVSPHVAGVAFKNAEP